jgi:large subunit ribosomal protein L24
MGKGNEKYFLFYSSASTRPEDEMKVKKGDTVQMLAGKDRGKQGRVIDARPREGKVLVENLNIAKRHTKPKPMRDTSRMGGPSMIPGGIQDRATPVAVGNVMVVCPTCKLPTRVGYRIKEVKGEQIKVRVCKREGCGQDIDI